MPAAVTAPFRLVVVATAVLLSASADHALAQQAAFTPLWVDDDRFDSGYAWDVSDEGEIVGLYFLRGSDPVGYRWTASGGFREYLPYFVGNGSDGYAISDDGETVVGASSLLPVRWIGELPPERFGSQSGRADGVSDDGNVVVGTAADAGTGRAFRWTSEGGMQFLGTIGNFGGESQAKDVSGDGKYVVGRSMTSDGYFHAFRWSEEEGMQDLGTLFGPGDYVALGVSDDGKTVVGEGWGTRSGFYDTFPFIWTEEEGLKALPKIGSISPAVAITDDKRTIAGGNAFWVNGEGVRLESFLGGYGISTAGWSHMSYLEGISSDGTYAVGSGSYSDALRYSFLVTLPPLPTFTADIEQGSLRRVSPGESFSLSFEASGPNGDPLKFFATGLPPGASITPAHNSTNGASFQGTLTWTPTAAQVGTTYDVHLYVRDRGTRRQSVRFKLLAAGNETPTVDAPLPVAIECDGGENRVELQALVEDADGDELTVRWSVNGEVEQTETLAAGSLASFDHAYPHGENVVRVDVADAEASAFAETTVTVRDTTAPMIVVAPSVRMAVEPGELYALSSNLIEPVVEDLCDGNPVIAHDALEQLPLGRHTVAWTVTDADGNVATAEQQVVVLNERPVADAGRKIFKAIRGQRTRVRLDGRGSYDPDGHALTFHWRAPGVRFDDPTSPRPVGEFERGLTIVKLFVKDEAGARSTDEVRVVLQRVPDLPTAASARIASASAYGAASRLASSASDSPRAAEALRSAEAAFFVGRFADAEYAEAGLDETPENLANYRELRAGQIGLSLAAYRTLYQAYLEGADETALFAGAEAYRGSVEAYSALVD